MTRHSNLNRKVCHVREPITKPYRVASGDGLANVWWKSGRITVKIAGAETGNAFSQIETDDPRGSGPPPHLHRNEDETFYVHQGEVTIQVGDERIDLAAGDFLFGPREVAHAYVVRSERARMFVTSSPAGVEQFFVNHGLPVTGPEPPTDAVMPPIDEMIRLFASYGCEILGHGSSTSFVSGLHEALWIGAAVAAVGAVVAARLIGTRAPLPHIQPIADRDPTAEPI